MDNDKSDTTHPMSSPPTEAYMWLLDYSRTTSVWVSWKALLAWDQRTYLPKGGHAHRARQISEITSLLYRRITDPRFGEMLAKAEGIETPGGPLSDEAVNLREWRRDYDRTARVPESLMVELEKASAESELAWQGLRAQNNWKDFLPYMKRIVSLKREEAAALSNDGDELYDALIAEFEPGENAVNIDMLFDNLAGAALELLERIQAAPRKPDRNILRGDSPEAAQENFIREILTSMGYDMDSGRLDRSTHPFAVGIGPGDVRITTRFDPSSFISAAFSTIHEAGHALYEQGLPVEHWGSPRGRPVSMAVHESQSRMWENMVARSHGFWKYFYPAACSHFPWLAKTDINQFLLSLNEVRPSLIRIEADEITYNLHIVMRFKLERMLIAGDLDPTDLPEAWNARINHYFHLLPSGYSDSVMQDIHWAGGLIGYFPCYALGNMYAAQFYAKAEKELGNLDKMFGAGDFLPLREWLRRNVHSQGCRRLARDLVKAVTGEDLNADYLTGYLKQKYERLYGLD